MSETELDKPVNPLRMTVIIKDGRPVPPVVAPPVEVKKVKERKDAY